MEQQLSLHFKIKKISEIRLEELGDVAECISKYLPKAESSFVEVHNVMARIHRSIEDGAVWFLYEEKKVIGFLVISIAEDTYGERFWLVNDFFVSSGLKYMGQSKKLVSIGIAWVQRSSVPKVVFLTKRNPYAMLRFLGKKWEIDSTVISTCVK